MSTFLNQLLIVKVVQGILTVSSQPPKTRKRGIKASKIKLHKAMAKVGIKTQAALANKIADIENLDTPPKDMVSRIFREISVQPSSIERVANAINVEAYSLYKSSSEFPEIQPDITVTGPEQVEYKNRKSVHTKIAVAVAIILLLTLTWAFYIKILNTPAQPTQLKVGFSDVHPVIGKLSLAIVAPAQLMEFSAKLKQPLASDFHTISEMSQPPEYSSNKELHDLEKKYQTDFVLKIDSREFERFIAIDAFLYRKNKTLKIWTAYSRKAEFAANSELFIQQIQHSIRVSVGLTPAGENNSPENINETAQAYYLEGRSLLDKSEDDVSIKSAQSRFSLAISNFEGFAEAHAGLCEALVHESWMGEEKTLLEDAQQSCAKAIALDPSNHYVLSTHAFLLRRTGRADEAISIINNFHKTHAPNVDTLYGLSYAEFESYRHTPEQKWRLNSARVHANKAIEKAPTFWKPYQILGLIEWTDNRITASLEAFKKAVDNDASELVVTNLGTLNLCLNNLQTAETLFKKSIFMSPASHMGVEQLGLIKFFESKYPESLVLQKRVLELVEGGGLHQMWGALADTYLKLNQSDLAQDGYMHALSITERDVLRGNFTPFDHTNQLYYKTRLSSVDPIKFALSETELESIRTLTLNAQDLDSASMLRLTLIALINNKMDIAAKLASTISSRCPVYNRHPDLQILLH